MGQLNFESESERDNPVAIGFDCLLLRNELNREPCIPRPKSFGVRVDEDPGVLRHGPENIQTKRRSITLKRNSLQTAAPIEGPPFCLNQNRLLELPVCDLPPKKETC